MWGGRRSCGNSAALSPCRRGAGGGRYTKWRSLSWRMPMARTPVRDRRAKVRDELSELLRYPPVHGAAGPQILQIVEQLLDQLHDNDFVRLHGRLLCVCRFRWHQLSGLGYAGGQNAQRRSGAESGVLHSGAALRPDRVLLRGRADPLGCNARKRSRHAGGTAAAIGEVVVEARSCDCWSSGGRRCPHVRRRRARRHSS
jgi:hypothetical protein